MAVRLRGKTYYVCFVWKGHRMDTATLAISEGDAKKIEKAVKTAFGIYRFDHLDPEAREVAVNIFKNKGWKIPPELQTPEPEEELTLLRGIDDYLRTDEKRNNTERKLFAIDRLVEFFQKQFLLGEKVSLEQIKVADVKKYQRTRQETKVRGATINIEVAVLSGIFRHQIEEERLRFNPCSMVRRLPEYRRNTYISHSDFQRMAELAGWLRPIIVMMYFTGMRPSEVFDLDWSEIDFSRRMIILPPERTKEGKNENQEFVEPKSIPMRWEVVELLQSMRHQEGNVVHISGRVFTHKGKPITRQMKRKCWARICKVTRLSGLQLRDLRHAFKTNLEMSGVREVIVDRVVGHATQLEVRKGYIHVSDNELLAAVDNMTFDHGSTVREQRKPLPKEDWHVSRDLEEMKERDAKVTSKSRQIQKKRKRSCCNMTQNPNNINGRDDWI